MRALSLPGCGCRGAFQFAVMARLWASGERFDMVAGASSGSICAAVTVAGLAVEGPAMWRTMARTPIVSRRWLRTERSIFGMSSIVRDALQRFLPEDKLWDTEAELLVSTTRARRFLARQRDALVVHSNRSRRDMHDILVASCTIPVLYARLPVIDGEVHVDGGAADNTLLVALCERGATDVTVVTPYVEGAVSDTLFDRERRPRVPPHVRLRLISPRKPLRLGRFDFAADRLEEALEAEPVVHVIEGDRQEPTRASTLGS